LKLKIILNKPFILTVVLLFAICFFGCATGPTWSDIQTKALEGQKSAGDHAAEWKERFLMCMHNHALKNARTSASASEIAEGAVSECQFDLLAYRNSQEHYNFSGIIAANPRVDLDWARERGEEKTRLDVQELTEQGKQLVINTLIKIRG